MNTVATPASPFHLYIGFYPGETGVYSLNGGVLNVFGGAYVGGSIYPGSGGGTGLFNIASGIATVSGELAILNYSSGSAVNLNGGTLSIGTLNTSNGTASKFHWNAGTLAITGTNGFSIGTGAPLGSALTLNNNQTAGCH